MCKQHIGHYGSTLRSIKCSSSAPHSDAFLCHMLPMQTCRVRQSKHRSLQSKVLDGHLKGLLGRRGPLEAADGAMPQQPAPDHVTGIDAPAPRCQQRSGRVIEIAAAAGGVPACR